MLSAQRNQCDFYCSTAHSQAQLQPVLALAWRRLCVAKQSGCASCLDGAAAKRCSRSRVAAAAAVRVAAGGDRRDGKQPGRASSGSACGAGGELCSGTCENRGWERSGCGRRLRCLHCAGGGTGGQLAANVRHVVCGARLLRAVHLRRAPSAVWPAALVWWVGQVVLLLGGEHTRCTPAARHAASPPPVPRMQCSQVVQSMLAYAHDVMHLISYGCYKYDPYKGWQTIRPCPAHVICGRLTNIYDLEKQVRARTPLRRTAALCASRSRLWPPPAPGALPCGFPLSLPQRAGQLVAAGQQPAGAVRGRAGHQPQRTNHVQARPGRRCGGARRMRAHCNWRHPPTHALPCAVPASTAAKARSRRLPLPRHCLHGGADGVRSGHIQRSAHRSLQVLSGPRTHARSPPADLAASLATQ